MNEVTREKLLQDLSVVVRDAEELLQATASQAGEKVQQVRTRTEASLQAARERLEQARAVVEPHARTAVGQFDAQVRAHPWTAIGMATGVGLLVGLLIGRR